MGKRGPGDGSIRKRPNGTWEGRVRGVNPGGEAVRVSVYGASRAEVQKKIAALTIKRGDDLPVDEDKVTVGEWMEHWLENHARHSVRASTFVSYEGIVRKHIVPALGEIRLVRLRAPRVQKWINDLLATGLAPRRVHRIHATLRVALGLAMKQEIIDKNVARLVTLPKAPQREIHPLSSEQTKVFLSAIAGDRLEALYLVLLGCGLRRGEALGLRWQEDIDFDAGTLSVNGALQRIRGRGIIRVPPKTERSRRTLPIPRMVLDALRSHRKRQLEERLQAGSEWQDTGYVFTSFVGTPLDGQNVLKAFRLVLANAELPITTRLHDLRHGAATFLLAQGVPARVVMSILGHSQIALTMDTYSHVLDPMLQDAASKMDDILTGNGH